MLTIVDYGLGNVNSFINIFNSLRIPIQKCSKVEDLKTATKIILPGVGSFDNAMDKLRKIGIIEKMNDLVLNHGVPVLGICVGMQIMARKSEEGSCDGLGWFDAEVKHISSHNDWSSKKNYASECNLPLPHMGWNNIELIKSSALFNEISDMNFYFLHSFYVDLKDEKNKLAVANYSVNLNSAIKKNNIYGVQFHPEKSHHSGIRLLKNFANIK